MKKTAAHVMKKKRRRVKNYRPRVTTRASSPFQKSAWVELESLSGDLFARTSSTPSPEYYPLGRSESRLRSGVPGRRSQASPVGSAQQKSHKRKLLPDAPDGPATYGYQRSERSFCQTGLAHEVLVMACRAGHSAVNANATPQGDDEDVRITHVPT